MRVLYTGAFRFPDGDAAARRVLGVARLFTRLGWEVSFAGWERAGTVDGHYRYAGHDCYSQSEFRDESAGPLRRTLGFFLRGRHTLRWLVRNRRFDVVVAYNPPSLFALGLLALGWWQGFRVVLDSTEWYQDAHLPGGVYGPAAMENRLRMHLVYRWFGHAIFISQFLERYYHPANSVILRPMLAADAPPATDRAPPRTSLRFLYAGEAGRKDLLLPFLRALPAVQIALGVDVRFYVAGPDPGEVESLLRAAPGADAGLVSCLGRVSFQQVRSLYAESHFSLLFREHQRYAVAGFPTKAVESWSLGCPVIANRVGDFGAMIQHMKNSILVDVDSLEADLVAALLPMLRGEHYAAMSRECRRSAEEQFSEDAQMPGFLSFARRLVPGTAAV